MTRKDIAIGSYASEAAAELSPMSTVPTAGETLYGRSSSYLELLYGAVDHVSRASAPE